MRIVIPGKVHRNEAQDATHSPIFHQVEGLCVDTNITFSDLKGTLDHAMKALFGSSVKTRFFPSFFPFTEPCADVQISCIFCGGKGCRKCKQSGWIELLGCGMVDPAVFAFAAEKAAGLRPEEDLRLRLRHGRGAHRHDEVRHQRDRPVLCGGYEVSGSVRVASRADSKLAGQRMSRTRHYRDLIAWQRAMELARAIYAATEEFPNSETFGLRMQLRRSAVNTATHIAEGHGRLTDAENRKSLSVARGSLSELQTQLELAASLKFIQEQTANELIELATEVAKLINGLIGVLEQEPR